MHSSDKEETEEIEESEEDDDTSDDNVYIKDVEYSDEETEKRMKNNLYCKVCLLLDKQYYI